MAEASKPATSQVQMLYSLLACVRLSQQDRTRTRVSAACLNGHLGVIPVVVALIELVASAVVVRRAGAGV